MYGHTQSSCGRRFHNLPPIVETNIDIVVDNAEEADPLQFLNMDIDDGNINFNSSGTSNGSSSSDSHIMPMNNDHPVQHDTPTSLEILTNQISAINALPFVNSPLRTMPQIQQHFTTPWSPLHQVLPENLIRNYVHLGTSTTMFELPSFPNTFTSMANDTHHLQNVEPYIPMPLTFDQALNLFEGINPQALAILPTT